MIHVCPNRIENERVELVAGQVCQSCGFIAPRDARPSPSAAGDLLALAVAELTLELKRVRVALENLPDRRDVFEAATLAGILMGPRELHVDDLARVVAHVAEAVWTALHPPPPAPPTEPGSES